MIPALPIHEIRQPSREDYYCESSGLPPTPRDRESAIQEFQQRLVLLHHASKCEESDELSLGRCRVSPHCRDMRALWDHVNSCSTQDCQYPHCISTRFLLAHYYKCEDITCMICKPLKESIKRIQKRTRAIVHVPRKSVENESDESPMVSPREGLISPLISPRDGLTSPRDSIASPMVTPREWANIKPQGVPMAMAEEQAAKYLRLSNPDDRNGNDESSVESLVTVLEGFHKVFQQEPKVVVRSTVSCGKCNVPICQGYRYFCFVCQMDFCSACFHCEGGGDPHEHPVRAFTVQPRL